MTVNKVVRTDEQAEMWIRWYVDHKRLPVWWPAHIPQGPNAGLCLFCNSPHTADHYIEYDHDPKESGRDEIEDGIVYLGVCAKHYVLAMGYNPLRTKSFMPPVPTPPLKYEDEDARRAADWDPDFEDYSEGMSYPPTEVEQEYEIARQNIMTKILNFVGSGLIPELERYSINGEKENCCFICEKDLSEAILQRDKEAFTLFNVPTGQKIEGSHEIIHPPVPMCSDCRIDYDDYMDEYRDHGDAREQQVTSDHCKTCEESYKITIEEYSLRLNTWSSVNQHECYECMTEYWGESRFITIECATCSKDQQVDRTRLDQRDAVIMRNYSGRWTEYDSPASVDFLCEALKAQDDCEVYQDRKQTHHPNGKPKETNPGQEKSTFVNVPSTTDKKSMKQAAREIRKVSAAVNTYRFRAHGIPVWIIIKEHECVPGIKNYSFRVILKRADFKLRQKYTNDPRFKTNVKKCGDGCGCSMDFDVMSLHAGTKAYRLYQVAKEENPTAFSEE